MSHSLHGKKLKTKLYSIDRFLMGKRAMTTADSCYLHIKQIGGNYPSKFLHHRGFQGVVLEDHINLLSMFYRSAMYP